MAFKNENVDECPECGSKMIRRQNKRTQEYFYGCSKYPECTGTKRLEGEPQREESLPSDKYRNADRRRWENE